MTTKDFRKKLPEYSNVPVHFYHWINEHLPKIEGWYAIQYCWDVEEGIFYGADYFDGDKWIENLPVGAFVGLFPDEFTAKLFASNEDPDLG